jgi:hypothetical protein
MHSRRAQLILVGVVVGGARKRANQFRISPVSNTMDSTTESTAFPKTVLGTLKRRPGLFFRDPTFKVNKDMPVDQMERRVSNLEEYEQIIGNLEKKIVGSVIEPGESAREMHRLAEKNSFSKEGDAGAARSELWGIDGFTLTDRAAAFKKLRAICSRKEQTESTRQNGTSRIEEAAL